MQVSTIGVDLAKNVFQVHGVDSAGKVVITHGNARSCAQAMP
jgi:transposase